MGGVGRWGREEETRYELIIVEVWVSVPKGSLLSRVVYTFETFHYKKVFLFKYPI